MSVLLFELLAESDYVHDLNVEAGAMRIVGEYRDVLVNLEPHLVDEWRLSSPRNRFLA